MLLSIALAIVLSFALIGCGGSTAEQPAPAPEPAAEQPAEAPAEDPAAKVAPVEVGMPVTVADWTLVAKEVEREQSTGGADAPEGQELLVITFDLTNGGSADQGTGPTYFKLTGSDGTEYQATPTSGEEFIFNTPQPIKAGETREIKIVYPVPTGATPFQWSFEPFVEGGVPAPAVVNIP
jgi:hypothetical protein